MKKLFSLLCALLVLALLPSAALATAIEDPYPAGTPLLINQLNNIEGFGYIIPFNFTLDQYALSTAAYKRPWKDKIIPYYNTSGHENKNDYFLRYIRDGYALASSSSDYLLVDVPMSLENRASGTIDPAADVSARLIVAGQYPWEVSYVYSELTDNHGNRYELLEPAKSIEVYGHAVVHYIFDIPAAAAEVGEASGMRADFTINGTVWSLELRDPLPTQAELEKAANN